MLLCKIEKKPTVWLPYRNSNASIDEHNCVDFSLIVFVKRKFFRFFYQGHSSFLEKFRDDCVKLSIVILGGLCPQIENEQSSWFDDIQDVLQTKHAWKAFLTEKTKAFIWSILVAFAQIRNSFWRDTKKFSMSNQWLIITVWDAFFMSYEITAVQAMRHCINQVALLVTVLSLICIQCQIVCSYNESNYYFITAIFSRFYLP